MKIEQIAELSVPLKANIQNAVVNFAHHTVSTIAIVSDRRRNGKPIVGLAFDSIGRFSQTGILRDRMIPRLAGSDPCDYLADDGQLVDVAKAIKLIMRDEKPGGHGDRAHAAAALELALWDLNAKILDVPAWRLIADRFGVAPKTSMPVYAAGGYYYGEDQITRLQDEIRSYADMGYTAFKIKIGGAPLAEDMRRIEAVLKVIDDPQKLAVDANARFGATEAITYGRSMVDFGLRWYEEPGDPTDFALMAELTENYPGRLATGENLFSAIDVKNLVQFGGMRPNLDIFQMDPALSYGLQEYARMISHLETNGFSRKQMFPHGGQMLCLHSVVGLGLGGSEAYPGVFAPFGGFAPTCMIRNGEVFPSEAPGFGLEEKPDLYACFQEALA